MLYTAAAPQDFVWKGGYIKAKNPCTHIVYILALQL